MNEAQKAEGLAYAERNMLEENSHLMLDKAFIETHYDLTGKKVLDFGCGMGGMTLWMDTHYNCDIKGIDIDANHIGICKILREKHNKGHVEFILQDIVQNPLDEKFDYIFLNDVAEHIQPSYLEPIFAQLKNQLKEGGVIFVSYPPWEGPYASHLNSIFKIPWAQYWPEWIMIPKLKKRNRILVGEKDLMSEYFELNHLNHKMLKGIIKKAGLKIERRMSHTKLNQISFLKGINLNFFPFKYLVTKELVVLRAE